MDIVSEDRLIRFANAIAGHYSNYLQAKSNSKTYAHINIHFCPLRSSLLGGPSLYSEQSYAYDTWSPYRQAVIKIKIKDEIIILENYHIKNAQRIAGAGKSLELLSEIKRENLNCREGCSMSFKELKGGYYLGKIESGRNCIIKNKGENTYLESNVAIYNNKLISKDEGYSINTNQKIWGSESGPFIFEKVKWPNKVINKAWLYGD